jgi:hypothetical protein
MQSCEEQKSNLIDTYTFTIIILTVGTVKKKIGSRAIECGQHRFGKKEPILRSWVTTQQISYVGSAFEKTKKISSTLKNALAYKIQKA